MIEGPKVYNRLLFYSRICIVLLYYYIISIISVMSTTIRAYVLEDSDVCAY